MTPERIMRWLQMDPEDVFTEVERVTGSEIAPWVKDTIRGKPVMVEERHPDGSVRTRCAGCRAWHNPIYSGDPEIQKWNDPEVSVRQIDAGICADCGGSLFRGVWTKAEEL